MKMTRFATQRACVLFDSFGKENKANYAYIVFRVIVKKRNRPQFSMECNLIDHRNDVIQC